MQSKHLPGAQVGDAVEVTLGNERMAENTTGDDPLPLIPLEHCLQQLDTIPPLISLCHIVPLQTHLLKKQFENTTVVKTSS